MIFSTCDVEEEEEEGGGSGGEKHETEKQKWKMGEKK